MADAPEHRLGPAELSSPTLTQMTDWMETARTRMRPFEETDAGAAFAWFSDPAVMKYIPGGLDATLEDTRSRIARYQEHQARFGFSKRLIIHRETGEAIGDAGLFHLPDGHRIELGFRLARPYWGAGYALEAGQAWLGWFEQHETGRTLFADVHPENIRSQRVLARLGFSCSHLEPVAEMPMLIYWHSGRISRERVDIESRRMPILHRSLSEPPKFLTLGAVTLHFSKILPGDAVRGFAPAYHYRIVVSGADAGHINLRMGDTDHIVRCVGHIGFEVAAPFRGHRHALSACRALAPFARSVRDELILTCDPGNHASRRTIELLGGAYIDEVSVPPDDPQYLRGSRTKRRFLWRL